MSLVFTPFELGALRLKNRLVMAPMQQYRGAPDGSATAYHEFHYGRCAEGGIGLIVVESTAVASEGRLFKDDIGIYDDRHVAPLRRLTDAVHAHGVPVFIQLSHGGRKSNPPAGLPRLAPSAIAFDGSCGTPEAMLQTDIDRVVRAYADAARRAVQAGFDGIELHAAHGYLVHQFLSPLSNTRVDRYRSGIAFADEVLGAMRGAVGPAYPIGIRVSASDYVDGGLTPESVAEAVNALAHHGLAAVHVSSGGLLPVAPEHSRPGYQVGYAHAIRQRVSVPVIAVGGLHRRALIEQVLADGQADLVAIGRPILERPDFMTDKLASVAFDG